MNDLDCIVIINDTDRFKMQTNFASSGAKVYKSLTDITRIDRKRYKTILMVGNYPKDDNNISIIEVFVREFKEFNYFYLGEDRVWVDIMSKFATSDICQIDILTNLNIFDFINNNNMVLDKDIVGTREAVELANKVLRETKDLAVKNLAINTLKLYRELEKARKEKEDLNRSILMANSANNILEKELDELYDLHSQMYSESAELNNTITQFETINSVNIYSKINVNNYVNKPNIIYLKQYERLIYQNSFIETLFKVFRGHAHKSVKVLVLYDNDGFNRSRYLKDYYRILDNNNILDSEIVSNDFIAKSGNYETLLNLLLTNSYGLDYLIIVDCKNHDDAILTGDFKSYNMLTNLERIEKYGLLKSNTIVNGLAGNIPGYLTWPHFNNYNSVNDADRILITQTSSAVNTIYSECTRYYEEKLEVFE